MAVVDVSGQAFPRSAGPPNPAIGHIRVAPELRVGHVQSADSAAVYSQPNAQAGEPSVAPPSATSSPAPNLAQPSAQHEESAAGAPTGAAPSQGVHFAIGGNDPVQAGYGPQSGTNTAAAPAGVSNAGPAIAGGSTHVAPGGRTPGALGRAGRVVPGILAQAGKYDPTIEGSVNPDPQDPRGDAGLPAAIAQAAAPANSFYEAAPVAEHPIGIFAV